MEQHLVADGKSEIFDLQKGVNGCHILCISARKYRKNAKNALKTICRTADLIKRGEISYCVCPEGTRNRGEGLLPFHDGVFKIAQRAGVPVVVVAVRGTEQIRKNAPWKRTTVYIDVLDVISVQDVQSLSSHELGGRAREEIAAAISV